MLLDRARTATRWRGRRLVVAGRHRRARPSWSLLALWWLLAQLRSHRLAEVLVDSGDGEGALLRGRALEDVLAAEAEALDGVRPGRVLLTGRRDAHRGPGSCCCWTRTPHPGDRWSAV